MMMRKHGPWKAPCRFRLLFGESGLSQRFLWWVAHAYANSSPCSQHPSLFRRRAGNRKTFPCDGSWQGLSWIWDELRMVKKRSTLCSCSKGWTQSLDTLTPRVSHSKPLSEEVYFLLIEREAERWREILRQAWNVCHGRASALTE